MSALPIGWVETTVGEACDVIQGQSPPGSSYNTEGNGLPFFQGKAEFGELFPSVRKWTTDPKKIAEEGDVLLSIRAPVGPTNVAPRRCVIGRGLAAIRPRGGIAARFVLYWLRSSERTLAAGATGSTFEAVSGSRVRSHPLPLPPLNEQRRIVAAIEEHLSRLDAAEASFASISRRLELLRSATLVHALEGEWQLIPVGDVAEVISGPAFKSATFRGPGEGVRLLRGENIEPGGLRWRDTRTWPKSMLDGYEHLFVEASDLILAMDRPVISTGLKLAPVRPEDLPALLVQRVARIRPSDRVLTEFLHAVLRTPRFVPHVVGDQTGTQLPHITLAGIRAFEIPLPPLDDQRRIVAEVEERISAIDALRSSVDTARRRSASLRRAILEWAFRGELVQQDPSDQPASELLERIRAEWASASKPARRRRVNA